MLIIVLYPHVSSYIRNSTIHTHTHTHISLGIQISILGISANDANLITNNHTARTAKDRFCLFVTSIVQFFPLQLTESPPDEVRSTGAHDLTLTKGNYSTCSVAVPHELRHRDPICFPINGNLGRLKQPVASDQAIHRDSIRRYVVLNTTWVEPKAQPDGLGICFLDRPDEVKVVKCHGLRHIT
jgi:hypothetical protein